MLTLKKVKELVEAPVHTKRVPSPKVLLEEGVHKRNLSQKFLEN